MASKIIQWNCNGFFSHLGELQAIIAKTQPKYVLLQETNLKPNTLAKMNGYTVHRNDRKTNQRASGGVAIFVKNTKHAEPIPLQTNIEAVAIKTYIPDLVTICNIYIPPDHQTNEADLLTLLQQLPKPYIISGDFNAHNVSWNSKTTSPRGKIIEKVFEQSTILNNGKPTHFCARSGTFSTIDLSFSDPRLFPKIEWFTLPHLYGSDHFPIVIKYEDITEDTQNQTPNKRKWNLKKANWENYKEVLKTKTKNLQICNKDNATSLIHKISLYITEAAEETIGYKASATNKKIVPWWNKDCGKTIKEAKKALNKYKRYPNIENLINLKKTKAIARRTVIQSKKKSWEEYVTTLNKDTPMTEIWNKIKK